MATTTTNFGWDIPQSTDLVKDGATAIAALGQDIDTALVDLKGGTTGQVLSKASNADMDFTWVTDAAGDITGVTAGTGISGGGTSGTVTVTNSMATAIDAKGDLIGGTGADTFSRLAVGANGTVLTADSAEATGLKWATTSGGLALINRTTFSAAASQSINNVFSSTYDHYMIKLEATGSTNLAVLLRLRVSSTDATTNYESNNILSAVGQTAINSATGNGTAQSGLYPAFFNTTKNLSTVELSNVFDTTPTCVTWHSISGDGAGKFNLWGAGRHTDSTSYTGFSLVTSTGTMTGSVSVYGYTK